MSTIRKLRVIFLSICLWGVFVLFSYSIVNAEDSTKINGSDTTQAQVSPVLVYKMIIDGPIGAVTAERISDAVKIAEANNAELLVIFLDTPGGFTKPTWMICKSILNSNVPVCVYIAPSGARAGSAGVYITYSANFAAMAPSTNIGAAHPVAGSGQKIDSVMNEKITNDAVAQIKAAAEKRGRNAQWAEDAVRHSVSIPDKEALKLHVIDFIANNMVDLLAQIDGKVTDIPSGKKTMSLKKYRIVEVKPTFIQKILEIITSPDIAFILMSIGGLGILLELYNPGSILPGVVGVISLILAFYAFQTLPINYAGLSLIILAVILFIAEIKIVSHGLLTIGGLISFFFGGLMLINTSDPNLRISKSILITVVACIGIIVFVASWLVIKASRRKPFIGSEEMVGKIAEVRSKDLVYVNGALWKAQCEDELVKGEQVKVIAIDKLTLIVEKIKS